MANVKLSFYGTENTEDTFLECFYNTNNEIYICIEENDRPPSHITLDKSTAIKLSKTLRTEISKMEDVNNG